MSFFTTDDKKLINVDDVRALLKSKVAVVEFEFDGNNLGTVISSNSGKIGVCNLTGGGYTIDKLYFSNGLDLFDITNSVSKVEPTGDYHTMLGQNIYSNSLSLLEIWHEEIFEISSNTTITANELKDKLSIIYSIGDNQIDLTPPINSIESGSFRVELNGNNVCNVTIPVGMTIRYGGNIFTNADTPLVLNDPTYIYSFNYFSASTWTITAIKG